MSKRRVGLDKEYSRLRKEFLSRVENAYCPVALNGFIAAHGGFVAGHYRETAEVHHKRGRGKFYLDVSTWLAVSSEGHAWIHANPALSYERGWMQKK